MKTYNISLDLPPSDRWTQIIEDYKDLILQMYDIVKVSISPTYSTLLTAANKLGLVYYSEEISSIADRLGLSVGEVILINLVYEAYSCCTSMIIKGTNASSSPIHMRSMDWELPILKDLTINVNFYKSNKLIYKSTTWAGYVGALTVMKPHAFSISINYRRSEDGTILQNLYSAVMRGWPVGFLLRETMETVDDYNTAVECLSYSKLIAPCYFIIAGSKANEGTIITRDRNSHINLVTLQDDPDKDYIIQTNIDHWRLHDPTADNIVWSRQRIKLVKKFFKNHNHNQDNLKMEDIWELYDTFPVKNEETVYVTCMKPGTDQFITIIPEEIEF